MLIASVGGDGYFMYGKRNVCGYFGRNKSRRVTSISVIPSHLMTGGGGPSLL